MQIVRVLSVFSFFLLQKSLSFLPRNVLAVVSVAAVIPVDFAHSVIARIFVRVFVGIHAHSVDSLVIGQEMKALGAR